MSHLSNVSSSVGNYNVTGVSSMSSLMTKFNEHSEGLGGVMALILFALVIYAYGARQGNKNAMVAGLFFLVISGILSVVLGLINSTVMFVFLILLVGMALYTFLTD